MYTKSKLASAHGSACPLAFQQRHRIALPVFRQHALLGSTPVTVRGVHAEFQRGLDHQPRAARHVQQPHLVRQPRPPQRLPAVDLVPPERHHAAHPVIIRRGLVEQFIDKALARLRGRIKLRENGRGGESGVAVNRDCSFIRPTLPTAAGKSNAFGQEFQSRRMDAAPAL